jgi:hypothetical protein
MGESVLERTIQFTAGSPSFRRLMSDLFDGTEPYLDLRRRIYRTLPAMLFESLLGRFGGRGGRTASQPIAAG